MKLLEILRIVRTRAIGYLDDGDDGGGLALLLHDLHHRAARGLQEGARRPQVLHLGRKRNEVKRSGRSSCGESAHGVLRCQEGVNQMKKLVCIRE